MDRLTQHNFDYCGEYCASSKDCGYYHGTIPVSCGDRAIYDRLSAYEDTGLEPEQVQDMMTDWVVWKEAESEGRLIVLPSDPYEMADVAQEILSRACRLQREAEAALGGDHDA